VQRSNYAGLAIVAFFFALTLTLGLLSDGVYHDDDLTHYLFARWSVVFPEHLLNIWGRPGLTIPLAAVAWIGDAQTGWHACRILSAIVTAFSILLAMRLARRLGIAQPAWVALFALLQPLNIVLATTTLTENFCALYLVAACVCLVEKRSLLASTIFSLVLVTRHESVVFLPIWALAVLVLDKPMRTRATSIAVSLWAPIVHNVAFWLVFSEWPVQMYTTPQGSTEYLPTGWLSYVPHALTAVTPVVAALALCGGFRLVARGQLLIPALACVFLLTHTVVRALGVFASGGYGRFLVTLSPFIAIMAAAALDRPKAGEVNKSRAPVAWSLVLIWSIGWITVLTEGRAGHIPVPSGLWIWMMHAAFALCIVASLALLNRKLSTPATALLALACVAQAGYFIQPLRLKPDQIAARDVVQWLRHERLDTEPVFTTNTWFPYFMGLIEHSRAHKNARLLASMPVGTIFIWDSLYSSNDFHRLPYDAIESSGDYELIRIFEPPHDGRAQFRLYRKIRPTPIPTEPIKSYPPDLASRNRQLLGVYYTREGQPPGDFEFAAPQSTPAR
jgi:hypothetical protein